MRRKLCMLVCLAGLLATGEISAQNPKRVNAYYTYPVECISVELDGSVTLRSWGTGRNRADAIEQARKNAVYAVLFKGINVSGQTPSMSRPLILENNAEQKYQYFFNPFFADNGAYTRFVSKEDTRAGTNKRQRMKPQVKYGVTIRVFRSELRNYLIQENIIKP